MEGDIPRLLLVQGGDVQPTADEGAALRLNDLEGAGNAVEDVGQHAGAQGDGHGGPLAHHRLAGLEAGRVLVDLDGGGRAVHTDHLADQALLAHADHIHHGQALAAGHLDDRAVDAVDGIVRLIHWKYHPFLFVGERQAEELGKVARQLAGCAVKGGVHPQAQIGGLGDQAAPGGSPPPGRSGGSGGAEAARASRKLRSSPRRVTSTSSAPESCSSASASRAVSRWP